MPIYEYKCRKCGETFELMRSMNDDESGITCPACGADCPQKSISIFSGASSFAKEATAPKGFG
ncbi:MAG: zinc ribbon domain-containing protein [Chloroflexota bacterium]|nr:zinc ribbon domain-containing protein [Chloroflexota bacterium]